MSCRRLVGIDLGIASAHAVRVLDGEGTTLAKRKAVPTVESLSVIESSALEGTPAGTRLEVVIEPTGPAWLPIAVFFMNRGHVVYRVSSTESADLRRYLSRHAKTNGIDADTLARIPLFHPGGAAARASGRGHRLAGSERPHGRRMTVNPDGQQVAEERQRQEAQQVVEGEAVEARGETAGRRSVTVQNAAEQSRYGEAAFTSSTVRTAAAGSKSRTDITAWFRHHPVPANRRTSPSTARSHTFVAVTYGPGTGSHTSEVHRHLSVATLDVA